MTAVGRAQKYSLYGGSDTASSGPGGIPGDGCRLGLLIQTWYGSHNFGCNPAPNTVVKYAVLRGGVTARRWGTVGSNYPACGPQQNQYCYKHADIEPLTIALDRVKGSLILTPTDTSVKTGTAAKFTASVKSNDPAVADSALPWKVVSWSYKPDGGTAGSMSCGSAKICSQVVPKSGQVTVTAEVNGEVLTQTARVVVSPCPTGVPLLDEDSTRAGLKIMWDSMYTGDSIHKRIERGFYLFRDSAGVLRKPELSPKQANDTPCSTQNIPSGVSLALIPVLSAHGHGAKVGALLPDNCLSAQERANQVKKRYGAGFGGPSGHDWRRSYSENLPMVVLDSMNIYFIHTPHPFREIYLRSGDTLVEPKRGWKNKIIKFPRNTGTCTRP